MQPPLCNLREGVTGLEFEAGATLVPRRVLVRMEPREGKHQSAFLKSYSVNDILEEVERTSDCKILRLQNAEVSLAHKAIFPVLLYLSLLQTCVIFLKTII